MEHEGAYANLLLPSLLHKYSISGRDAGFIQEISFGVIRQKQFYEQVIAIAAGRRLEDIDPNALIVLRIGAYQILDMRVPNHASVNESVELAKAKCSKSAVGFVNAVLRKISRNSRKDWLSRLTEGKSNSDELLAIQSSHPLWIVRAIRAALTSRSLTSELADALYVNNEPANVQVVALPGLLEVAELPNDLTTAGPASPIGAEIQGNPSDLVAVQQGIARVQDQGSQLMALALAETEIECQDQSWLDLCAGPGGKSALLAAMAKSRAIKLVCNEPQPHRANLVRQALKPIDKSVEVLEVDGRILKSNELFSRILLDAPCTGLGALRRRPEARWRKTPKDLDVLTKLQRELLENAWQLLEPGGVLAYVTCSPHVSETTAQVSYMESRYGAKLRLLNASQVLNKINPWLALDESFYTAQLWPHRHKTDAMFVALFVKRLG